MTITLKHLRAQAVRQSLFDAPTVGQAIVRLGFVQADPIQAPARAQDLILRQRVPGYRASDLERNYAGAGLEEDMLHVYGFMPATTLDLLHPRAGTSRVEREHAALVEQLLSFVASNGHTSHRDLEAVLGGARTRGYWGNQAKVTTLLLDALHYRGKLRVAQRKGNERFYTISERQPPAISPEERLRQLVLLILRLYAPVSQRTLRDLVSRLGIAAPGLDGRRTVVKDMLASGELAQAEIDGATYYWPADITFEPRDDGRVRLLAPFDPIVYDRTRFEHLWGWPYRFEAYTPAAKRKWGYYALPMLWRDQIIGWANVSYTERKLHAQLGFAERRPAGKDFKRALDDELARMTHFLATHNQEIQ
jgi:uncharacterized protein YcaQ